VNVNLVTDELGVTFPTANRLVARFEELRLLTEMNRPASLTSLPLRAVSGSVR